jgi:hypothetical protein
MNTWGLVMGIISGLLVYVWWVNSFLHRVYDDQMLWNGVAVYHE